MMLSDLSAKLAGRQLSRQFTWITTNSSSAWSSPRSTPRTAPGTSSNRIVLIDELERGGHDATQARQLLETMTKAQAMHEDERDRLASLLRA